jgi:POT family proton-dependent oligopeptide transporter
MTAIATRPPAGMERPPQRTFLGHPIGLYVLFFTEMWERFSYYGMRALLMLYMLNYFRWGQKDASTHYKVYTSLVYVTPILGGYLADRVLGNKWAVIIGAALMAVGHFLMAFEEYPIFLSALIFLIIGNGFFKPNMSTQVGRLYPTNDGRRDGAYTIFYMGINLGAFLSPLVCGWLADNTVGGYHSGFTMAGIGMVTGLVIYLLGQPLIREIDPSVVVATPKAESSAGRSEAETPLERAAEAAGRPLTEAEAERVPSALGFFAGLAAPVLTVGGAVVGLAGVALTALLWMKNHGYQAPELPELLQDPSNTVMVVIVGGSLLLMGLVAKQILGGMRDRVLAILTLGVFVIFFWAAFEQAGNVLNVWADKNTDRYLTREAPPAPVIPEVIEEPAKADSAAEPPPTRSLLSRFATMFQLKPRTG